MDANYGDDDEHYESSGENIEIDGDELDAIIAEVMNGAIENPYDLDLE